MNTARLPPPAEFISHRGDAVLLDEILEVGEHHLRARLLVRPGTAFSDAAGHLPGWVGPEVMAQAIAALSGHRWRQAQGRAAPIGLLLGVRAYEAVEGEFHCGETLQVEVVESSEDEDGRAVVDGRILRGATVVASGTLTVFQPPDDAFLEAELAHRD